MEFDVCIIGGGTGGYVAAIKLAQGGKHVALVEQAQLGGVCLNKGCIPTKTLLKSAEKWAELEHSEEFGIIVGERTYDWEKIMERKTAVVAQLRGGVEKLLKGNKIEVFSGEAHLVAAHKVVVQLEAGEEVIEAENIILATGSEPVVAPIEGVHSTGVITSDDALQLSEVPASMVVVGAGAVGLEFAAVYASFGCAVTVVEMAPAILPPCDVDVQRRMGLALRKQAITVKTSAAVQKIAQAQEGLEVTVEVKGKLEVIPCEKVLLATGRRAVFNQEELDALGVTYERRGIVVNDQMETSVKGIYAVGDVNGLSMLAHSASHQGLVAAANILGEIEKMDYTAVPSCVFTRPEIAQVGLTEQECKEKNIEIIVNKFNFAANGKAVSMNETEGLVKVIATADKHIIIGVHIIGPHASDLIGEGIVAVQKGLPAEELAACIHPHPTLSEGMAEAVMGIGGKMIHQLR